MIRRSFLRLVFGTSLGAAIAAVRFVAKTVPRGFVNAVRCRTYPGRVREPGNIDTVGKWSG